MSCCVLYVCQWCIIHKLHRFVLFRVERHVYTVSPLSPISSHTDVLHIEKMDVRARRFPFQILATGAKFQLATESAEERKQWMQGLEDLLFGPPKPKIVCEWMD